MPLESLVQVLRDSTRPAFLFGSTPPKEGTTIEQAKESCRKFAERSSVLATDGFIIYDIQDEAGRTEIERPFPFRKTMDASLYATFFPPLSGKQCVVYKCGANESPEDFQRWLDMATDEHGHRAYNLVGAATSKNGVPGLSLSDAASLIKSKRGIAFGCVCIPERHTTKGNEDLNMIRKVDAGAEWFITQGIFNAFPVIKLIHEYGELCVAKGMVPKKVILTFAPCGRAKTMTFIKWLGMNVPEEVEKRILESPSPVKESMKFLQEVLKEILLKTAGSGVPIGVNVESLSIFKEEIDAAHELFQSLQVLLLNSRGSPWTVRWLDLRRTLEYTANIESPENLDLLHQFYSTVPSGLSSDSLDLLGKNSLSLTPIENDEENKSLSENQQSQQQRFLQLAISYGLVCIVGWYLGKLSASRHK